MSSRYLDLSNELLFEIISYFEHNPYLYSSFTERQKTLRSLVLVDRKTSRVAYTVLYSYVKLLSGIWIPVGQILYYSHDIERRVG